MVTTGFRNIYVAKYSNEDTTVSYTGFQKLARARGFSLDVGTSDDNQYFADDSLAETESGASFSSGTLELTVDGLTGEEEALLFGIDTASSTVQVDESPITEVRFGDKLNPPFMGVAGIKRYQLNGVVTYRPIVLPKVQFTLGTDEAETGEDTINWQDQTLNANIMRDDTAEHNWKRMPKDNFATLAEAIAYIEAILNPGA